MLDQTVVITGAARGVGRACARRLARMGADLVLVDIAADLPGLGYELGSEAQLAATADDCRALGAAVETITGDVRNSEVARSAVTCAMDRFGSVGSLINNAGVAGPAGKPVFEVSEEEWGLAVGVNLTGPFQMIRSVAPLMVEQRRGAIVNIASTAGIVGYRHFVGYVSAKHGLIGLTKAAALDLAPYGVRVNAVCPGSIRDDPGVDGRMLASIAASLAIPENDYEAVFREQQPLHQLIEADDVASAVVWLLGEDSARTTGSSMVVDGGFTAR